MTRSSLSLLAALSLAACAAPSSARAPGPGTGDGDDDLGISNPQGTSLLGVDPALEGFHVDIATVLRDQRRVREVRLDEGRLVVTADRRLTGPELVGTVFPATTRDGGTVAMRLAGVARAPGAGKRGPQRAELVVEVRRPDATWAPLCEGGAAAVVVPGAFGVGAKGHPSGDYDPSPTRFTFACPEGVAAKCIDWGYAPWGQGGKLARYYQACTRMARADYCGNGRSRTVEGTMINYGDLHDPPITRFAPLPGFVPEAVWGPGSGADGKPAAICLSRSRWSTIPIGPRSPCADLMPDPRDLAAPGPRRFCDDMTVADWAREGEALFVNNSRMLDVGLFVWTDGAGHYVSTSQHPWLGKDVPAEPPPGYPTFVSIEGSMLKPMDHAPKKPGLVTLYRHRKQVGGATRYLTTIDPSPGDGWGEPSVEGYVYGPVAEAPVSTAQRLLLHGDGRGNFVTTTDPAPPPGYAQVAVIGWLPH